MDLGIKGKVVLVTGGARGLGRIDGLKFAEEGCRVALCDLSLEATQKVVAEIEKAGGLARAYACDISKPEQARQMVDDIRGVWKPVDILINNAACLDNIQVLEKMEDSLWLRDINVNLIGTYYVTKTCYIGMREQNWGRIITMASVAGVIGGFGQTSYAASKGGILGLMKSIALEGGRFNITANSIVAGLVQTEAYEYVNPKMRERIERRTVLGRAAQPEEVVAAILFLASEGARYITGSEIYVTGGIHLFTF
jgi:3-oxoacyl-[acyl-carrier protein] reductase